MKKKREKSPKTTVVDKNKICNNQCEVTPFAHDDFVG